MKKLSVSFLIMILVLTSTMGADFIHAESLNDVNSTINELKKQQQELTNKKSEISGDKNSIENKIHENVSKQHAVNSEIDVIDQQLADTTSTIEAKENEIKQTNEDIIHLENEIVTLEQEVKELNEEIKELQASIKKREELLKERLRSIQKNGGEMRYMEVLLGAKSFVDFISRTSAVHTIMEQDKTIMESLNADKVEMEEKKESVEKKKVEAETAKQEIEKKKAALEVQKQELLTLKNNLDNQMAEKEKLMAELEEEHNHLEQYKMGLEEQRVLRNQEAIINKAIQEANARKKELEQLGKNSSEAGSSVQSGGSGVLSWPVSGRVSSGYGSRSLGMHLGIDIVNSYGSSIKTAASGIVSRADYSSSYGNVVYVYHPQLNLTTVYAHLASISVSYGQSVSAGQQIGTMGNTGNVYPKPSSSNPHAGTHLHFEVHQGGWSFRSGVNPMSYLN